MFHNALHPGQLVDDLRSAARSLKRRASFSILAIGTLAVGIGAATSIYSIVDGVLLAPLPYRDAAQLTAVYRTIPRWREVEGLARRWNQVWFSYPAFREWQARQTVFESVGAWSSSQRVLRGTDGAEIVDVTRATSSLLGVLGARPARGRYFVAGEDVPPGARIAVLGHEAWLARFGGDEGIIGRSIRLDDASYEVVGVLPPGLDLTHRGNAASIWIPGGGEPDDLRAGSTNWFALGRLRSGTSLAQGADETARLVAASSPPDSVGARLLPWHDLVTQGARPPLVLLLAGSALLLLLAAVNVATIILGESGDRVPEFATRVALGANRTRIVRQILLESALLGLSGVAAGVLLAAGGARALVALMPYNLPRLGDVAIDWGVLAVASAVGVLVAVIAGIGPAIMVARDSGRLRLDSASRRTTSRREGATLRSLIGAQVALSCVLLISAALLGQSLYRLSRVEPGLASRDLVMAGLGITSVRHASDEDATTALFAAVAERIAATPGVERASVGSAVPFSGGNSSSAFQVEGIPAVPGSRGFTARRSHVLSGFTEALGLRLLEGRTIADRDRTGAPLVAVINQTMAQRFWPGTSAVGRRISMGDDDWITVVGVVSDVHHQGLGDSPQITVYLPAWQWSTPFLSLVVRSQLPLSAMASAIRQSVAAVDPTVPVTRMDAMSDLVNRSFAGERYRSVLIGVFAVLATLLASIGIFGVTARAVAQQRRDIGIRMAIGSPASRVVLLFVQRTGVAVGIGCVAGLGGALVASRFVAPWLFATNPVDPVLYAGAAAVLGLTAVLATWLPARRAALVHPAMTLRN